MGTIHHTAVVHPTATIDPTASLGAQAIVGSGVTIGAHVKIGDRAILWRNASVGDFPHAPSPRHSQSAVPVVPQR